ncbi:condensation domain-containing protein, partial [Thauera sinica]
WSLVLARTTGREDVVFGTVLFGRMQGGEGADRVMGMFINTLPVRLSVDGESVETRLKAVHGLLARLLRHEHAPLALAQRCSAVQAPAPLFTSLLNYRYSPEADEAGGDGAERPFADLVAVAGQERTNYPLTLAVDDLGEGFLLTMQVSRPIGAARVCGFMQRALEVVAAALERDPQQALRALDVLPAGERTQVLEGWNATARDYPAGRCLHELIEAQANRTPQAVAVRQDGASLTYAELNARANRLAHHLRTLGVGPD